MQFELPASGDTLGGACLVTLWPANADTSAVLAMAHAVVIVPPAGPPVEPPAGPVVAGPLEPVAGPVVAAPGATVLPPAALARLPPLPPAPPPPTPTPTPTPPATPALPTP